MLALAGLWSTRARPCSASLSRWIGRPAAPLSITPSATPPGAAGCGPARGSTRASARLLAINALFPLLLIALPSTPIFGGTKHWLPAYPFLALLAGWPSRGSRCAARRWRRAAAAPRCSCLLARIALPGALSTWLTHPFGLSQYNALAGGPAGGADLGLNRQFWGYATRQLLPWINKTLPTNARVYFHDTNHASLRAPTCATGCCGPTSLRRDGAPGHRRLDLRHGDPRAALQQVRLLDLGGLRDRAPAKVLDLDGVPLVSVYKRPSKRNKG